MSGLLVLLLLLVCEQALSRPVQSPHPCLKLKLAAPKTQDVDLLHNWSPTTSKLESDYKLFLVSGVDLHSLRHKAQQFDDGNLCTAAGYSIDLEDSLKEKGLPLNVSTAGLATESGGVFCILDGLESVSVV